MKNIFLITALILLGCSKSTTEEPINNIPAELIGKWKITETYTTDGGSPATWSLYDSENLYDLWLKSNGKYTETNVDKNCNNGTYLVNVDQIIFSPCASTYPYTIENLAQDTLILRDNLIPDVYKTKYKKVAE